MAFLEHLTGWEGWDIRAKTAPLRKTKRNWAMRVLTFATNKQKGDNAVTGDPPNVVDKDNA
jgi:hypothetical protein